MHYHALVLTSPDEVPSEELVTARMAPHEESYTPGRTEDDEGAINGHWDWFVIGGRWDGALYPEQDDGHVCPSFHCGYSDLHHQLGKNARPVQDIPEGVERQIAAIITPDGRWLECVNTYDHPEFKSFNDEGYQALSDRLDEEWRRQVRRILVEHNDCGAISVDIHS